MTDLGTFGGVNSFPVWLNDVGEIVGEADLTGSAVTHLHHAFLWNDGVMTNLGTLGSTSHAEGVNSSVQVAGRSRLGAPSSVLQHAFLWENGGPMMDLGSLGTNSTAVAINSQGQIVGASRINATTNHAFLWEDGGPMIDLNTLVAVNPSGLTLVCAFNINDRGEITGLGAPPGVVPTGCGDPGQHPFLLIPCGAGEAPSCEDPSVH